MDENTVEKLLTLNRAFYAGFAESFADSRTLSDPALTSILPYIAEGARVLDVGCGNGRLALLLDQERAGMTYVGIDAVPELVEVGRAQAGRLGISTEFHILDISQPSWGDPFRGESFDYVVTLAVLHHIPSFRLRARTLREMAELLAPRGRILLSTWQFIDSDRMRRKIVDWTEAGIPAEALETGDYLLDWNRGGRGLRYCHLVDETELRQLAAESGLSLRSTFRAGGREGNLSLFAVLDRKRQVF
jgi:2-polyprenyl-3-methyl-5-hydroxy-6-metoxy-1,4-benzoquinol methylase